MNDHMSFLGRHVVRIQWLELRFRRQRLLHSLNELRMGVVARVSARLVVGRRRAFRAVVVKVGPVVAEEASVVRRADLG